MGLPGELLRRHSPTLRYDSAELWFAESATGTDEDRIYGHVAEGSDGRLWLQYWFYYRFNDPRLIGPWLAIGRHEGDWEMIQLRLAADRSAPALAIYAHHAHVSARPWTAVERVADRPVVHVGRGSHASYFRAGWHWTGVWVERANGRGRCVTPELTTIVGGDPAFEWVSRPQRWGSTVARGGLWGRLGLKAASPSGPGRQRQWRDPAVLLAEAGLS